MANYDEKPEGEGWIYLAASSQWVRETHHATFSEGPQPFNPAAEEEANLAKLKLQARQHVVGRHIEIKSSADYHRAIGSQAMMDPKIKRGQEKDVATPAAGGFAARGLFIDHSEHYKTNC